MDVVYMAFYLIVMENLLASDFAAIAVLWWGNNYDPNISLLVVCRLSSEHITFRKRTSACGVTS